MASSQLGLSIREHFAYLPPPAECLAILVGTAELVVFGLGGLSDTTAVAKGYGLNPPSSTSSPEDRKTNEGLIRAIAARNIQNGALILTFALYTRDRRSLGLAVAYGVITTLADSWIVAKYGVKDLVGGHVVGVVNSLLIGGSLLWWKRGDAWW